MRLTRSRLIVLTGGVAGSAVAGAVVANALIPGAPGLPPPGAFRPEPGSVRLGAQAADPGGLAARWAVRFYRGRTGLSCLEVGHFDGRSFGVLSDGGKIVPARIDESGSCGDVDADVVQFGVASLTGPATAGSGHRTVLFGRAAAAVARLRLQRRGRADAALRLGPERTFIAVLGGLVAPQAIGLLADLKEGGTRTFSLS